MSSELDVVCEGILQEFSTEKLAMIQQEFLKYVKEPIMRIHTDMAGKTCSKCIKKPIFYETETSDLLCWKHANDLSRQQH